MYHQELARSGHALFSVRGLNIHAVWIIGAAIAWHTGQTGPFETEQANCWWQIAALGVALAGAFWRVIVSGYAALGTSGNAKKEAVAAELNTTGPYSLVRNPLYVGRILNFTGIAMLSGSWVWGAIVYLVSVLVYERISFYEEEFLKEKFGEAHRQWAEKVPALWPKLTGWVKPKYPFWWKRALLREHMKFLYLALAVAVTDFARHGFVPPMDWTLYSICGGVIAVTLAVAVARYFGRVFEGIN